MDNQKNASTNLIEAANKLSDIYEGFTEAVQALGNKSKGRARSSKMGGSFAHWIGGSHVVTDRESLCEKFLADVQGHLEILQIAIESVSLQEASEICTIIANIMMEPRPAKSDATTDLMKRAMIGQVKPFLSYVPKEQLAKLQQQMENAYGRWKMLPVEKEIYKEVKYLITQK